MGLLLLTGIVNGYGATTMLMDQPPCSPDVATLPPAPTDFQISEPLKQHPAGKRFATDADVKEPTET
jgi:hypothetical protein